MVVSIVLFERIRLVAIVPGHMRFVVAGIAEDLLIHDPVVPALAMVATAQCIPANTCASNGPERRVVQGEPAAVPASLKVSLLV